MATAVHNSQEQSATSLVSGIVDDFQALVKQQLQLTRQEILEDLRKAKEGALLYSVGVGILVLGALALVPGLAHLLHWATSPAGTDPASLPMWACYLILAAVFGISGGVLVWWGDTRFQAINPLDNNPATEAMKENLDMFAGKK